MALAFHLYIMPNGITKKYEHRKVQVYRSYADRAYIFLRRDFDKRRAKATELNYISFGERYTEKIIRQRSGQLGGLGKAKL